jgi:2-amino-4-hydroxy-6-hydroxymethyldihydropteridine diphosphokinase
VLDLDLVLWSGGAWASDRLVLPHPEFRRRTFVLAPAATIAPAWRDPLTGLTVRQLGARLNRANPVR